MSTAAQIAFIIAFGIPGLMLLAFLVRTIVEVIHHRLTGRWL